MAKKVVKKAIVAPIKATDDLYGKVFSNKYQCLITKADAYYDETLKDWLNEKIEANLLDRKNAKK